ncbi:MAG: hypothetical protein V7K25_28335 [Nostoc sp.]|uniref:hypothetical protein n=1 Tax=Nostoc sp. TaxID=1180 RepID=UPI002FF4ACF4
MRLIAEKLQKTAIDALAFQIKQATPLMHPVFLEIPVIAVLNCMRYTFASSPSLQPDVTHSDDKHYNSLANVSLSKY